MELNPLGGSGLFTTRCSLPSSIVEVAAHRAGIETVTHQHFSNYFTLLPSLFLIMSRLQPSEAVKIIDYHKKKYLRVMPKWNQPNTTPTNQYHHSATKPLLIMSRLQPSDTLKTTEYHK